MIFAIAVLELSWNGRRGKYGLGNVDVGREQYSGVKRKAAHESEKKDAI